MSKSGEMAHVTGQLHTKTGGRFGTLGAVLRVRNFRMLWIGQGISVHGDQFYMIALPWLVLQLTGDALAVGTVLALVAFPRALFMLVGGALIDRFSPRNVMLAPDALRLVLVTLLTLLILAGSIQMWMLYGFALLFGLAAAFFYPAQPALIPQLLEEDELQTGNVLNMGTAQLGIFVGPVVAGGLIALMDTGSVQGAAGSSHTLGIAVAFGVDALSSLVSLVTLWMIHLPDTKKADETIGKKEGMFASIRAGLVHAWNDYPVRLLTIFLAAIMLLINGPFVVVVPVLSATRFAGGAAAFGIIMSAFGGGALLGMVLAGVLPKLPARYTIPMILVVISSMGTVGTGHLYVARSVAGSGNGYSRRLYRNHADYLGAKAHTAPDAMAYDEPGDVCYYGPDPSFDSHSRCLSQTEPDTVPARHRRYGCHSFTSGRAEFPDAREGYDRACNPLVLIYLSYRG